MANPNPKNSQDFSLLEKEALREISLDIIKSDLQKSLRELHQKNMADVAKRISTIEMHCTKEIREGLEKHIERQLDQHFQKVVQSYQADISKVLAPLMKRAEEDVSRLNNTINKTDEFCQKVEAKYTLRWSKPFFVLTLSAGFAGAFMGLTLLLLQVPFLSVFLMNAHTRETYEIGARMIAYRKEQPIPQSRAAPQATSQEPKAQKTSETSKKKKKPSKR